MPHFWQLGIVSGLHNSSSSYCSVGYVHSYLWFLIHYVSRLLLIDLSTKYFHYSARYGVTGMIKLVLRHLERLRVKYSLAWLMNLHMKP